MLVTPFSNLALAGSVIERSQPIGMGDFNASQLSLTVNAIASASAPTIKIQISNDMENWFNKATITFNDTVDEIGAFFQSTPTTDLGMAYIRIEVTAGAAINLTIHVNLSKQ
jgi:hypothetical protein